MLAAHKLTQLQIELVKTFSMPISDNQVLEIKTLLSKYFLDKMDNELDGLCQLNNWNQETFDEWANGHERTNYKP